MKRPEITIGRRNMLLNLGVGAGWIISAVLGVLESHSQVFHNLDIFIITIMALVLLYTLAGKHEANDEMSVAHSNEAYRCGFLAICFAILLLLFLDKHFISGGIPFNFAGYFIMGVGNITAGWKFYQLERDGE